MIQLTRLNGQPLIINSDLIKFIENAPDTVISLLNGEKIVVRETGKQILERIVEFRRQVLDGTNTNCSGSASKNLEGSEAKSKPSSFEDR